MKQNEMRAVVEMLLRKVDVDSHPNINGLWGAVKDIDWLKFNVKNMGYSIARQLQAALPTRDKTNPSKLGLSSRPARQSEVEADWFSHWCNQLKIPVTYHRKIWEFCYVLQSLYDAGLLSRGKRGIGFGCGEEPIPSFLASQGIDVTVTDLHPEKVSGLGWIETGQHSGSLDHIWYSELVDRDTFNDRISLRYVDMNNIPRDLKNYDFCWSICALEHLGSIQKGLDFIKNSISTVRMGGYAIHTTEYNFLGENETIDNWPTVLFLRKHFEELSEKLENEGHKVYELKFDVGSGILDKFVDIPPYSYGEGWLSREQWNETGQAAHLKLSIDGYACTCFGFIVRRGC